MTELVRTIVALFALATAVACPCDRDSAPGAASQAARSAAARAHGGSPDAGGASTVVPFDLVDNRIFVDVTLDGLGPFRMIFDTGGGNVMRPEVAKRLGLAVASTGAQGGVGEKTVETGSARVGELRLGGVRMADQSFTVLPFDDAKDVFGTAPFDGIVGHEILERYVATIDYERRRLTLTPPEAFAYDGTGTVVPMVDSRWIPIVEGRLDGVAGRFAIDTGARSALVLYGPFVEKNGLRARYAPKVEGITGWGIGGPVRSQVARVGSLELGKVEVRDLVARLSTQRAGILATGSSAALVGPDVLAQFTLVVDYSRRQLVFERNASFGRRDTYDRAGMWLGQEVPAAAPGKAPCEDSGGASKGGNVGRASGGAFTVLDVIAGGPAAEAGLAVGDRVLSVDGTCASTLLLPAVRARFKSDAPGTRVRLLVDSAKGRHEVVVTLRDLV